MNSADRVTTTHTRTISGVQEDLLPETCTTLFTAQVRGAITIISQHNYPHRFDVTHHISRPPASLYSPYATASYTSHDFSTNPMHAKSASRHLVFSRGAEGKATHRGPAANGVFVAGGMLNPCWYFLRRTSPRRGLLMAVCIRLRERVNSSLVFELDHLYTGVAAVQEACCSTEHLRLPRCKCY
jgi:hypothetical protein